MKTLSDLLANIPPIGELQQLTLIFNSVVAAALADAQSTLPVNRKHKIQPILLTDGRWLLMADVLSEIGETGIFKNGFLVLPSEYFPQVEVVDLAVAKLLIPVVNIDLI